MSGTSAAMESFKESIDRGFASLREGGDAAEGLSQLSGSLREAPEEARALIAPRAKELVEHIQAESLRGAVPGSAILLLANVRASQDLLTLFKAGDAAIQQEVLRAVLFCYRPSELLSDFASLLPEVEQSAHAAREDRWRLGLPAAFLAVAGLHAGVQRLYEASSGEGQLCILRELAQALPRASLRRLFPEEFVVAQLSALPRGEKRRRKALLRIVAAAGHELQAVRKALRRPAEAKSYARAA